MTTMTTVSKIAPLRMVVVGVGGIGSWLAKSLGAMLAYGAEPGSLLLLVDGDTFEPRNAERQDFTDLGNKAEVVASEVQARFPDIFVVPDTRWVVPEADGSETTVAASDLLEDGDVVYAVVDNFAARALLVNTARNFDNIDVFLGGNDDALFGSVYHYQRRGGRDMTDHPADYHPELLDPPDRNPGELSCQERAQLEGGTQLIATNMAVCALLLGRTQYTIFNGNAPGPACENFFDLAAGLMSSFDRSSEVEEEGAVTPEHAPA